MTQQRSSGERSSGAGMAIVAIVIGLIFIVGPIAGSNFLGALSQLLLIGFGVVVLLVGAIITVITRLYVKTPANEAFVRTGMGGNKPIIDGGAVVIPALHEIIRVNLETIKVEVKRTGQDAIICGNKLRADVIARFYIKVPKQVEQILKAAESLGDKTMDDRVLLEVIGDKLESALRDIGATKTLEELNSNREEFASAVQAIVEKELKPNGLELESTTILHVDQTSPENLRPDTNVFDAEGARTIAEITQKERVKRNLAERTADKEVKQQDVERDQFVYRQELERVAAEAAAVSEQEQARAKAKQEAESFTADQMKLIGVAQANSERDVRVAGIERERAADVAEKERQKAVLVADVHRAQAQEIADRERQVAVALAERKRAEAEAEQLGAEQKKEAEKQAVITVEQTATAEREKQVTIINKEADARQKAIDENNQADIKAYAKVKEAEGKQEASVKEADAIIRLATAERDSKVLEAEGEQKVKMVPVTVDAEQVKVDHDRLEQQEEFGRAAIDLQIRLAEINANKEAKIEAAKAMGEALSKADMTIWGDPDTFQRMSGSFLNGQDKTLFLEGMISQAPDEVKALLEVLGPAGSALLKKLTGVDLKASGNASDTSATAASESTS